MTTSLSPRAIIQLAVFALSITTASARSFGLLPARSVNTQQGQNVSCTYGNYTTTPYAVYNQAIKECRSVEGHTVPAGKTLYFWDHASNDTSIIFHIHNACDIDEIVNKTRCELKMDHVANICSAIEPFTSGSTDGYCVSWGLTVIGPDQDIPVNNDLTRRDEVVLCDTASPQVPNDELLKDVNSICKMMNNYNVQATTTTAFIVVTSVGVLEFSINNKGPAFYLDTATCLSQFTEITQKCTYAGGNGYILKDQLTWGLDVKAPKPGQTINGRAVTNSSQCTPGNATIAVKDMQVIVEDFFCPVFANLTLVPQESFRVDYYIPEGDLVFEMTNICDSDVKMENDTCVCGYDKVASTCTVDTDRFVNGTVDVGCLRLATWVNATHLTYPDDKPVTFTPTTALASATPAPVRRNFNDGAPGTPTTCPFGGVSPYSGNVTDDVYAAIDSFCNYSIPNRLEKRQDWQLTVPLTHWPKDSPIYFDVHNVCDAAVLFDRAECRVTLKRITKETFNNCGFIYGQGSGFALCQSFGLQVGNILG